MINADFKAEVLRAIRVSRETESKLELFAELISRHGTKHNLIAASTIPSLWQRHIHDSAQLMNLASPSARRWIDVGSGAGLPGLVLAILSAADHVLIEPRRLRAEFLHEAILQLDLERRVTVVQSEVQRVTLANVDIITARAFASLAKTIAATYHLASLNTVWLLHKGKTVAADVAELNELWEGDVSLTPSATDPSAAIVTLSQLRRRTSH